MFAGCPHLIYLNRSIKDEDVDIELGKHEMVVSMMIVQRMFFPGLILFEISLKHFQSGISYT